MDASGAYTAGYSAGLKGQLLNSNYSADNTVQTSYTSGYNAGKALYTPAFTAGYKDAAKGSSQNTFYSGTKAVQQAYNAGYLSLTQTNKIGVAAAYDWFIRASISSTSITSIDFDSNNNIIFCGMYSSGTQILYNKDGTTFKTLTATANFAVFIAKYTYDGVGIWAINFDGTGTWDVAFRTKVDANDNVLVCGLFTGNIAIKNADGTTFQTLTNTGGDDSFLVKYNSSGIGQWVIKTSSVQNDNAVWFDIDQLGNIYIGFIYSSAMTIVNADNTNAVTLAASTLDGAIIKFNSSGIYQWHSRVSTTGTDAITSLVVDNKNNVYLTGYYAATATIYNTDGTTYGTLSNAGSNDCFIVKYNTNGQIQWTTRIGSTAGDIPFNLLVDSFNNLYVSGYYNATLTFYNSNGSAYGTTLAIIGGTDNFIAKYNESGSVQWINRVGGTAQEANEAGSWGISNKIAIDKYNNIYLANSFTSGTLYFYSASNVSTAIASLTNTSSRNGFMAKYDSSGNFIYSLKTGNSSTNSTYGDTLLLDNYNYLYLAISNVGGTATLFDSSQVQSASLTASNNVYLVKYNQRNTTAKAAYDAGYAAKVAAQAQNTSYSTIQDVQAAYNAGYENAATQPTDFYYMGFNDACKDKLPTNTASSNATLQASYNAGFTAGQAAYKTAYAAGYTAASTGQIRNTSYSAADISANEIAPKQAAYDLGYYGRQNSINFHNFSFEFYTSVGKTGTDERGRSTCMDSQNNLYTIGIHTSATSVYNTGTEILALPATTAQGAYLLKQTTTGTLLNAFRFFTATNMDLNFVEVDSENFIYVGGYYQANIDIYNVRTNAYLGTINYTGGSSDDGFITKLTQDGVPVWTCRIKNSGSQQAILLSVDRDNSLYVTFKYNTAAQIYDRTDSSIVATLANAGNYDIGVVKYTSAGSFVWAMRISSGGVEYAWNQTAMDSEGSLYIVGGSSSPTTVYSVNGTTTNVAYSAADDGFLVKISKDGNHLWNKTFLGGSWEYINFVATDSSDNVMATNSAGTTIKYDKNGNQLWSLALNIAFPVTDSENNIYGYSSSSTRLSKYSPSGTQLYSFQHGISSAARILLDNNNNVYMTGTITNGTGLDSSGGTGYTFATASSYDAIVVKYTQRNPATAPAYDAGTQAYEAGLAQNTSYSATPETQAAYDAGYSAAAASHYNAGYADGVEGFPQNTAYSTSATKQASYTAGYTAGSALFTAAYQQGYKDGSNLRGKRTYSANQYVQVAYEQGYEAYLSGAQTQIVKSDWYARTASTGADSADAVAKDSKNNIFYGGYIGSATATVFHKSNVSSGTTLAATTQTAFIAKQTEDGVVLWASRFTTSSTVGRITGIVCDKYDNVYTYGIFNGTLTLYGANAVAYPKTLVATSTTNSAFLIKQSSTGAILWATSIVSSGSTGVVTAAAIAYDGTTDTVYVNGSYSTTTALVLNSDGTTYTTLNIPFTNDSFSVKYNSAGRCQFVIPGIQSLYATIPTTSGLVAYFDPVNVNSYSGSGATLTSLVGSASATLTGSYTYTNGNLRLNNTSTSGTSNTATLQFNTLTYRTISFWYYIHSVPASAWQLFDGYNGTTDSITYNNVSTNFANGTFYKNGGSASSATVANIFTNNVGAWTHITLVLSASGTDNISLFGQQNNQYGINVTFGPVQVYDRVITQAENLANYNATKSRFIITTPTTSGLVAYFDPANSSSYSGSGATLTSLVGSVSATLAGSYSYANRVMRLNNTSATGTSNTTSLQLPSITFRTISVWVYIHSIPSAGPFFFDARSGAANSGITNGSVGTFWSTGTLYKNGGSALTITDTSIFTTGAWQHITLVAPSSQTDNITFFGGQFGDFALNCSFGPIQVYNTVLTQAENLANYNATKDFFLQTTIPRSLAIDSTGDVYQISDTSGTAVIYDASGSSQATITTAGSTDIVVAKYSSAGLYKSSSRITSIAGDIGYSSAVDSSNNLYVAGYHSNNLSFYDMSGNLYASQLSVSGGSDGFLVKYRQQGSVEWLARPAPLTNGLVAYFDPSVPTSYSGSGASMTSLVGSASATLCGSYSYADGVMRLNNTSADRLQNRSYFGITSSITYRTISMWIYIYSIPSNAMLIDARYTGSDSYVYNSGLQIVGAFSGGTLYKNGGSAIALTSANVFTTGSWMHLTFVTTSSITGSNFTLFADMGIPPSLSAGNGVNLSFGAIQVYDRVLTQAENAANYNLTKNRFVAGTPNPASVAVDRLNNVYMFAGQFITKYSTAGAIQWSANMSAAITMTQSKYITIDDNMNIYVVGGMAGSAIVDTSGNTTYTLPNAGSTDAVLVQYRQRNSTAGAAYTAGVAAFNAGSALSTSYSADARTQLAYAAGYNATYEYYYYNGYNRAFQNKALDTSFNSVAIYQTTYAAGYTAGKAAYKVAYAAGYKDAALNKARNTSYSASSPLIEVGPRQAGYDDGYYTQKNQTTGAQLTYEWYYCIGNAGITEAYEYSRSIAIDNNNNVWYAGVYPTAANMFNYTSYTPIYSFPSTGLITGLIVKQAPDGTILKIYRLTSSSAIDIYRILTTSDNKLYILAAHSANVNIYELTANVYVGTIQHTATGVGASITKFGPENGIEWTCRLKNNGDQNPRDACIDKEDNIIVSIAYGVGGLTIHNKDDVAAFSFASNSTNGDAGFVKINKDGIPQWGGYINAIGGDNLPAITVGTDGSVYVVGSNSGGNLTMVNTTPSQSAITIAGGNDTFMFKVSKNGIYEWKKNAFNGGKIIADNSNNIIVRTNSTLVKYNAAGTALWTFSTSVDPSVVDRNDNIYAITGATLYKISSSGTTLITLLTNINQEFNSLVLDNADSLYMLGNYVGSWGTISYDSYGNTAVTTPQHGGQTNIIIYKYKQKTSTAYPTYYNTGFTSYSAATYTTAYSADAEVQATYDAGYQVAADSFVVYYNAGLADAAAGTARNTSYNADASIQTAYSNGYTAYTTAYTDGFNAGSTGAQANNTYTSNATLSARYTAGYTAGLESVIVVVVPDSKKSVATYQTNRTATIETFTVALAASTGLDASGNFQASSAPYISSATSAKGFTTTLADKLRTIETTYTPRTYVDQRISTIVDAAPAVLNTLKELADSLANNPAFYSTVVASTIAERDRSGAAISSLSTLNSSRDSTAVANRAVLQTDLSGEINRAIAAETTISTNITDQTTTRLAEISSVSQVLQNQINLGTAQDGLLTSLLNVQTTQRQRDVATLNNSDLTGIYSTISSIELKADTEISTSTAFLSTISSNLYSEIVRSTDEISTITSIASAHSSTSIGEDSTIRLTLSANVADLSSNLVSEIGRAQSAETGLSTLLGTETERGLSTISTFTIMLGDEAVRATTREQDISGTLRSTLTAEESRATLAEQGLSTSLGLQTASATTREGTLTTALNLQITTAGAAEQDISGTIRSLLTTEIGRAGLAEADISSNLHVEISRATTAETNLTSSIVGETNRAQASMSTISAVVYSLIMTEQTRATTTESDISANLHAEISRATQAETDLTSSIVGEQARAQVSMSTISAAVYSLILTEQSRASTIEGGISTTLGLETVRAISTVVSNTSTLAAEQTRAQAAEAALSSSLQAVSIEGERTRAIAMENDISANLATEVGRASSAETALTSTINGTQAVLSTLTASLDTEANGAAKGFSGHYIAGLSTFKSAIDLLDSQLYSTTSTYASLTYVDNRLSTIINGASSILNTLVEIDTALNNDPAFANTLISTLGAETVRATGAETDISGYLATELNRATTAETGITSTIAGETARSQSVVADISSTLYSALSTASGFAQVAEALISTTIENEFVRATGSESTITASLGVEISRAQVAEQDISGATRTLIANEQTRAQTAEQGLSTALATELGRATTAETALTSTLNAEISRATQAEQDISGATRTLLSTEISRAQAVQQSISTAIMAEQTRATGVEEGISTTIGNETSRALVSIADISAAVQALISVETSRSQALVASISTAITDEAARAGAAETGLTGSVAVEISRAQGGEQDISGAIHLLVYNETVRATNAETDISGRLADETVRALAAEQAATSTIAGTYIVRDGYVGQASINTMGTVGTGVWQATTVDISYGGTGFSSYSKGDILLGSAAGSLEKLGVGTAAYALKADDTATATWAVQDTSSVVLTDAANFSGAANLQQALNFLYANTKTRKVIDHVLTNSTNYSDPVVPNANYVIGKVHFINYDASNTIIYLPPVHQNVSYADGTVYRLVHNGDPDVDGSLVVRYRSGTINGAGTTITGTTYTVLEMGPRDSICIIWDQDSTSYKYATGI